MLRCKIQRMAILLLLWGVAPTVFAQSVDITGRTLSTLTDQALNGVPASGDAANSSQASGSAAVASQNNQTLPDLAAATPKQFSYGDAETSILFLPEQVTRLKDAIRTYESTNKEVTTTTVAVTEPTAVAQPVVQIVEPDTYPVFFLSTIAYDAPNDWSIWVGGHKITSRKNNTDVKVLHVSRDAVTFSWHPTYADAIARRRDAKQFAPTDAVKNKLAVAQNVRQDDDTGVVTFTLRQNQSFPVAYFKLFEGYIDNPKLPPFEAPAAPVTAAMPANPGMPMPGQATPPGMGSMPGQRPGSVPPGSGNTVASPSGNMAARPPMVPPTAVNTAPVPQASMQNPAAVPPPIPSPAAVAPAALPPR